MNKYSNNEIEKFIADDMPVRINMNLRSPIYGKLVALKDHEEMLAKGFVRFVVNDRIALFEGNSYEDENKLYQGRDSLAKLIAVKEITYIKQC